MPSFVEIGPPLPEKVFIIYRQGSHLGHVTWIIYIHSSSQSSYRCFISNLALISLAVSENIFEYYGNIHVYCPRVGADQLLGSKSFRNHKSSVHLPKFFASNENLTIFPNSNVCATYVDLAVK